MNSSRKRTQNTMLNFFAKVPKNMQNYDVKSDEVSPELDETTPVLDEVPEKKLLKNYVSSSSFVSDMDIGLFVGMQLNDSQKLKILENSWRPDPSFSFPANEKGRKFQHHWLQRFNWLSYSAKFDGAFCKVCIIFSNGEGGVGKQKLGRLVLQPFKQWKDALECFAFHQSCQYHKNCSAMANDFKKIIEGKHANVGIQLHSKKNLEIERNRQKLCSVIKTVILCGRQGLPLRGHRDSGCISVYNTEHNDGNFRALLRFRAEAGDENLKDIETGIISKKYTSPDIQNEILEVCGQIIQNQLVEKINAAKCFVILADETTDISGKEFLTLCIRYVEESDSACVIKEDFIDFIEIENMSGSAIADVLISNLKKYGIDISYLRGQGYDGAASMSGKLNGVQAKIREKHPTALYVHCCNHVLNLVLSKSCTVPSIRNALSTVQEVVTFFRASAKRRKMLKNIIQDEEFSKKRNVPSKSTCLKKFCETRWVERHEALFTFCECFNAIILTLQEIHEDTNTDAETSKKAMLFCNSLCQSNFIVALFVAEKCFAITYNLSVALQKPDTDLVSSYNSVKGITELFKKLRENSENKFGSIFRKAVDVAAKLNLEISHL